MISCFVNNLKINIVFHLFNYTLSLPKFCACKTIQICPIENILIFLQTRLICEIIN